MTHRVLVADDSTTIQKVIKIAFARHSLELVEAASYTEALSLSARRRPQLLIVDATLPGTRGPQDIQKLRDEAGGVPVILFVGSYDAVDEEAFRAVGIYNILRKPFDSVQLVQTVEDLLQLSPTKRDQQPAEAPHPPSASSTAPKHPTMYVTRDVPPPPPGAVAGFAGPESSLAQRRGEGLSSPPPPPMAKVAAGSPPPFVPAPAAGAVPPPPVAMSVPPPPPMPKVAAGLSPPFVSPQPVVPPPPGHGATASPVPPPPVFGGAESFGAANPLTGGIGNGMLGDLPDLPFELSGVDDQEAGFIPNMGLSSGESSQAPLPPPFPGMPQAVSLDGARRGQKAFETADLPLANLSGPEDLLTSGSFPSTPAAIPSTLMEDLTRDLPELVRRVVEDYCERHFKSLAREFIASELRRLADEKARHLVDN